VRVGSEAYREKSAEEIKRDPSWLFGDQ